MHLDGPIRSVHLGESLRLAPPSSSRQACIEKGQDVLGDTPLDEGDALRDTMRRRRRRRNKADMVYEDGLDYGLVLTLVILSHIITM